MVIFNLYLGKHLFDIPRVGRHLRRWKNKNILSSLRPGEVAIDCGANVGNITEQMAISGAKVFAFEPNPYAYKVLVSRFANRGNVVCINKAISDHNGVMKLYLHSQAKEDQVKWSTASSLLVEKTNVDQSNFVECEVVDLSEFLSQISEPIGLIKMDIEGEEVKVINKLIDTGLVGKVRNILVETHERIPALKEDTKRLKSRLFKARIKNVDLSWS